jgi:uncharacterized protein (DUF2384 family)
MRIQGILGVRSLNSDQDLVTLVERRLPARVIDALRAFGFTGLCHEVFGEPERAWRWLRDAKRQFHARTPLELLATEAGARVVEELLYRIDEGMAA